MQVIKDIGDVKPGQRVLIHGAAGSVGHLAVQIAKLQGAYVYATAKTDNINFIKDLGADQIKEQA
jgi:NADPH:quinone reductase-like Zn-dependent oxidoreductase